MQNINIRQYAKYAKEHAKEFAWNMQMNMSNIHNKQMMLYADKPASLRATKARFVRIFFCVGADRN